MPSQQDQATGTPEVSPRDDSVHSHPPLGSHFINGETDIQKGEVTSQGDRARSFQGWLRTPTTFCPQVKNPLPKMQDPNQSLAFHQHL